MKLGKIIKVKFNNGNNKIKVGKKHRGIKVKKIIETGNGSVMVEFEDKTKCKVNFDDIIIYYKN